jgi:hypothetical protein
MPSSIKPELQLSLQLEQRRILSRRQTEEVTSLSWDTIERHHPEIIIQLSPRRDGVRLGDALAIGERGSDQKALK